MRSILGIQRFHLLLSAVDPVPAFLSQPHDPLLVVSHSLCPLSLCGLAQVPSHPPCPLLALGLPFAGRHLHGFREICIRQQVKGYNLQYKTHIQYIAIVCIYIYK